eukprot:Pgem_evm1s4508
MFRFNAGDLKHFSNETPIELSSEQYFIKSPIETPIELSSDQNFINTPIEMREMNNNIDREYYKVKFSQRNDDDADVDQNNYVDIEFYKPMHRQRNDDDADVDQINYVDIEFYIYDEMREMNTNVDSEYNKPSLSQSNVNKDQRDDNGNDHSTHTDVPENYLCLWSKNKDQRDDNRNDDDVDSQSKDDFDSEYYKPSLSQSNVNKDQRDDNSNDHFTHTDVPLM